MAILPDVIPSLSFVTALILHLRTRAHDARLKAVIYAVLAYLALGCFVPDLIKRPPVVMPFSRYMPFVVSLLLTSVAHQPKRILLLLACFTIGSISHVSLLFYAEGQRLAPQAAAICGLPAEKTILAVPLHRRVEGSELTTYTHIHLPFMYQVCGRGQTLAAFALEDSPVHLRKEPSEALAEGPWAAARFSDMVLSDDADVPEYATVSGLASLKPCPFALPWPWKCRVTRAP